MKLFIVDAIGPFFRGYHAKRINWSKVPFHHLETADGGLDAAKLAGVRRDFGKFIGKAAGLGFNAITLDDVAHLALHPDYPPPLRGKIGEYRQFYQELFELAAARGLRVFITTDIMFFNEELRRSIGGKHSRTIAFLAEAFGQVLDLSPAVAGIICRVGECDGMDVQGDFRSRLIIRTPGTLSRYIRELLPVFERRGRLMVMRTWTVGAYRVGDLMWNPRTFDRAFRGVGGEHFAVSLKYGESDFFRYLPLNPLFHRSQHQKIVELQARREYEGMGEYPSFIGWDYEYYARRLERAPNMLGVSVWCQTGGWSSFRSRTLIKKSPPWNELNAYVAMRLFKDRQTVDQAVRAYCREYLKTDDAAAMIELLRLSEEVVKELLYVDDFARGEIYFRRLRLPPLIHVFWDNVIVNDYVRQVMRCFVVDGAAKIQQGRLALEKIDRMRQLARRLGLHGHGLRFQQDSFAILAAAREYLFGDDTPELRHRIESMVAEYKKKYRRRYSFKINFEAAAPRRSRMRVIMALLLRRQRGYRILDHIFTIRLLSLLSPLLQARQWKAIPSFARKRTMGVRVVLK